MLTNLIFIVNLNYRKKYMDLKSHLNNFLCIIRKNLILVVKFWYVRTLAVPVTGVIFDGEGTCCGGGCECSGKDC